MMIGKTPMLVLSIACLLANVSATKVEPCTDASTNMMNDEAVTISGCTKPPCILKKKTSIVVEQRFFAPKNIESLTTMVSADVLGINLPFVGVTGTDACRLITRADGPEAGCPLVKGQEYIYKNSFPVLNIYPSLPVTVHWALTEGNVKITCFQVASRIRS